MVIAGALLLLGAPRAARADEVLVFAAISTTEVMEEAARAFTRATGHTVRFSFAGTNMLARQIRAGAPADVFLSADEARMDELQRAGLVRPADRRDLLGNQLVVVVPSDSPVQIRGAADLAGLRRIALADPESVPAGIYTRRWLESRGEWAQLVPRVVSALDVRAALAAVAAGRVDAGVVYRTDATSAPAPAAATGKAAPGAPPAAAAETSTHAPTGVRARVRIAYTVPLAEAPRIVYPVARLAGAPHPAAADALCRWLAGPAARAIFDRYGFRTP